MQSLSRRDAIRGGTALAATATLGFPAMADDRDAELLVRVADFWEAYRDCQEKSATTNRLFESIKAPFAESGSPAERIRSAEAERCGYNAAWDTSAEADTKAGAAANAVFSIPAHTLRGCLEKVRVARIAVGDRNDFDEVGNLAAHQDNANPWIDNAIADLEQLARGAS